MFGNKSSQRNCLDFLPFLTFSMVHFNFASSYCSLKQLLRSPVTSMSLTLVGIFSLCPELLAAFNIVDNSLLKTEGLSSVVSVLPRVPCFPLTTLVTS